MLFVYECHVIIATSEVLDFKLVRMQPPVSTSNPVKFYITDMAPLLVPTIRYCHELIR